MRCKEQNKQKMSWMEMLLSLEGEPDTVQKQKMLGGAISIPDSWSRLLAGKRIIVFYASVSFQAKYVASSGERAQQYMGLLCSLGDSTANMNDVVLWWYDDGSLRALLEAVEDENERKKLDRTYMWTLQLHLAKAVHDESGDFARALAWGDIYYGDNSAYGAEFQKKGKPTVLYTLAANTQSLDSWLMDSLMEHELPALPDKWVQCIRGRKVMLFSMQPQTLLVTGSRAVTMLENLIYLARERQDVCVWWSVDTELDKAVSMLSEELRQAFEMVRKEFLDAPNVIYDDSGEVGRALEHADVCFGESRDVKGKHAVRPVVDPPYYNLKSLPECPQIVSFCREGEKLYFTYTVRNVFGVLCELDLTTDMAKILCQLPNNEKLIDWGLDYLLTCKSGKKIIIPPMFTSEGFLEYDINSGKLTNIPCGKKVWEPNWERFGAFGPVAEWQNSIYFAGNGNGLIVEYRKRDSQYIYHEHWLDGVSLESNPIFGDGNLVGDIWYLTITNESALLMVDMRSMTASICNLSLPKEFQPRLISRCEDELWISPVCGNSLVCLHIDSKEFELVECPSVSANQKFPFSSVVPWSHERLIFPYFADEMFVWKPGRHEAKPDSELTCKLVRPFEKIDTRNEVCMAKQGKEGESFLSFRVRGTELIEFWPDSGKVRYHRPRMDSNDVRRLTNLVHMWNLRNLLKPLTDEMDKVSWRLNNTVGQRILESVKKYYEKCV